MVSAHTYTILALSDNITLYMKHYVVDINEELDCLLDRLSRYVQWYVHKSFIL
jgi:hypothetical protein